MSAIYRIKHPGAYIREELEERGWTQVDLAHILGYSKQTVNLILAGKQGITARTAKALGEAFDVAPEFFLNLQKEYDLSKAQEPDPNIAKRAQLYKASFPIRAMINRGWLLEEDGADLLEVQMLRFFGVDEPEKIPHLPHAAKKTHYYDIVPPDQLAWLFRVRHIAKSIAVPQYSEKKLSAAIPRLKALMVAPEEVRHVPRILEECGIRYVVVEALPKAEIDGVCFWLNNKAPVIGMSTRYDRIDNFWFVLWHEITHVLNKHGRRNEMIDRIGPEDSITPTGEAAKEEDIANKAAADFCVPIDKMESFYVRNNPYFYENKLLGFARLMKVHPGIVVGQLHYKTKDFRQFRKYLDKIREFLLPSALVDGWGEVASVEL